MTVGKGEKPRFRVLSHGGHLYLDSDTATPESAPPDASICAKVSDKPETTVPGSRRGRCVACDAEIWIDPYNASLHVPTYCSDCALTAISSGAFSARGGS